MAWSPHHLVSLLLMVLCLTACSSHKYFNTLQQPVLVEQDAQMPATGIQWQDYSTTLLIKNCFNATPLSMLAAADIVSCNNELLGRSELTEQQRGSALQHYNRALSILVQFALQHPRPQQVHIELKNLDKSFEHDQLILLSTLQLLDRKLQYQEFGELGVLAVAARKNSQQGQDKFYPLEGIFRSVNFLFESIHYAPGQITLTLTYQVVSEASYITKGGHSYLQKYSPSAAFLALLEQADIDDFSLLGLIQAAKAEFRRGIFAIEPISATKIPLIMTHGLNSDPLIWRYLTMALLSDAEINRHFQIWHFYYPSGPPPFFTAMKLRKTLTALVKSIPNAKLADKAVFVGHSMGGIISHVLTSDSQYALWDSAFVERPESLINKDKADPELENIFIFEPVFKDNTVFFLDTPHLGSEVATSAVGYISSWLVNLPFSFRNLFSTFTQNVGFDKLSPAMQPFGTGPNSIQVLRPGHPMMLALRELPVAGRVYSIIGSESATDCITVGDCNQVSDSVVSYHSAHFAMAEQEIIVPSTHNSFESDIAINFIKQKLHQLINGNIVH